MNNKRTLVISAVAVLAVIITVAASLVFTRSAQNVEPIPVTGLSNWGESRVAEIFQQNHAAGNSSVTNNRESAEQIQAEQSRQALKDQAANSSVTNTGESPEEEYILSQQYHAAGNSNGANPTVSDSAASQPALQVTEFCPFTLAELQTLHTVYYKDINVRMLETKDGPIGYDGGAFALSQCRISK